ncbi:amino acid deaminase/aldolase [Nocardioides sp. Kera G14]|uniref:amino acid deaminase/aldolase n=1 Tax=Nocardioides sp. Kera G14 TaxID=2884264 RepID=UPI001D103C19|nr:amino acid deaminase/aldolase [Nocardioides sp. Kera G14]UDY25297.1 amino acid deaminase/aldolase [Nocardioides sp. Kera G14]
MGTGVGASAVERNRLWTRLSTAVAQHDGPLATPTMVVDLDAFTANAADLCRRAAGTPIRVASKSLRVPALISRALAHPGFAGVLGYTLAEALWLDGEGISDDIVLAYPTVDRAALAQLVVSPSAAAHITLMVDSVEHLEVIDSVRSSRAVPVRVAIDLDAGLDLRVTRVGPRRSPVTSAAAAVALAEAVVSRPGFRLVGVMTYEGQVAGVADDVPGQRLKSAVVRRLKDRSIEQLLSRRADVAAALRNLTELEFWNAGGSGSIESSASDPIVTEVTAGSGLLVPGLFDHYRSFTPRPAAFFGLPVTRRPDARTATVHGGGLIASGPTESSRAPLPWAPAGLSLTGLEGAGEVQTPLTGPAAENLRIGDLVWFRHAKSGELFEHTATAHLLAGSSLIDSVPTYRGCGLAF